MSPPHLGVKTMQNKQIASEKRSRVGGMHFSSSLHHLLTIVTRYMRNQCQKQNWITQRKNEHVKDQALGRQHQPSRMKTMA
jgi:hypothetical protein